MGYLDSDFAYGAKGLHDAYIGKQITSRQWRTPPHANIITTKKTTFLRRSFLVGLPGFEPRMTGPESVVLPLHHSPISVFDGAKVE